MKPKQKAKLLKKQSKADKTKRYARMFVLNIGAFFMTNFYERINKMFKKIIEAIEKYDRIIIHRHSSPDGDALGSQIGLKHILQDNFPND